MNMQFGVLPDDDDTDYFFAALKQTATGSQFWEAVLLRRISVLEIGALERKGAKGVLAPSQAAEDLKLWRGRYAQFSDRASLLLSRLSEEYHWPAESSADTSFTWRYDCNVSKQPTHIDPASNRRQRFDTRSRAYAQPLGTRFCDRVHPWIRKGYKIVRVTLPPRAT
jgi:hypothetical protein